MPEQMRVEFWNRNNVFGVDFVFKGVRATITEDSDPLGFALLCMPFVDKHGTTEYPNDDNGIEVFTFNLA